MVNGYTDERRTPKAKPAKTLSQAVQLVNDDCWLNPGGRSVCGLLKTQWFEMRYCDQRKKPKGGNGDG
jgi:hypothetical protein